MSSVRRGEWNFLRTSGSTEKTNQADEKVIDSTSWPDMTKMNVFGQRI